MVEKATETVTVKASPELINEMLEWSGPLQVRLERGLDGSWEMSFRKPVNDRANSWSFYDSK